MPRHLRAVCLCSGKSAFLVLPGGTSETSFGHKRVACLRRSPLAAAMEELAAEVESSHFWGNGVRRQRVTQGLQIAYLLK